MNARRRLAALGLAAALALVVQFEGKRNSAYQDAGGVWTICYGHTGADVHAGMTASDEKCDALAAQDLVTASNGVRRCVHAPMSSNVLSAFSDLAFNIGVGRFCASSIVTHYNAGDTSEACARMQLYNKAGGRTLAGLTRRRAAESELCEEKS